MPGKAAEEVRNLPKRASREIVQRELFLAKSARSTLALHNRNLVSEVAAKRKPPLDQVGARDQRRPTRD